jgi:uncharacterized membrane protein (DUF485 family)
VRKRDEGADVSLATAEAGANMQEVVMAKTVKSVHELLESHDFKQLVAKRWSVSVILTIALFVIYYGYILLIGYNKPFLAQKIGEVTTLGIPLGVAVIILSWVLTVIYVVWANNVYDVEVQRLKDQLK